MRKTGQLNVTQFNLRDRWDHLTVNGIQYTKNSNGPDGVVVRQGDRIRWKTGNRQRGPGFNICLEDTNAPTASPTDAPTLSPTGAPTLNPTLSPTASPTQEPTAGPTYGRLVLSAGAAENQMEWIASACHPRNCPKWGCDMWCTCWTADIDYESFGCPDDGEDDACACN